MNRIYPFFFLVCCALGVTAVQATPVGPMNYQGRLLDNAGIPVTGAYDFVVKIYDDPAVGTLKYQENHTDVAVEDGVYSFKVGNGPKTGGSSLWDTDLWQGNLNDLYLEIVVEGETLSPRHELTSAPHAFTATLALALGNKTAEEYDNILEGVCAASKGKWLDNIERCLGVAATITNENAATMASDLNYNDLDLSKADITNTLFANANFSNTVFKNTTLTIGNFSGANLTGARLENVISSNTMPNIPINLTNATITNMSLAGWNLSSATVTGLSAANLSACPSALPADWFCAEMKAGSGTYFLFGPGANLSAESAAAITKHGQRLLDTEDDHFAGKNLSGASFEGLDLSKIDFTNTNLSNANLDFTSIDTGYFDGANLSNVTFRYSTINSAQFTGATLTGNDFTKANIEMSTIPGGGSNMVFHKATLRTTNIGTLTNADFSYVLFSSMTTFTGDISGTLNFSHASFRNGASRQDAFTPFSATTVVTDNMTVLNGELGMSFAPGTVFDNFKISNASIRGTYDSVVFNNCSFQATSLFMGGSAKQSVFNNCQFTAAPQWGSVFLIGDGTGSLYNTTFNGGTVTGSNPASSLSDNSFRQDMEAPGPTVSLSNIAFSNVMFTGNWSNASNTTCAGCTFTNTSWDLPGSAVCPGGGTPVETPAASGIYQCAGWY